MSKVQARKYQITINNPQQHGYSQKSIIETASSLNPQYFCMADEIGEAGTYHTHLFVYRKSAIRFDTLKRKFPDAHIEVAFGSCQENKDYITKSGKWADSNKAETSVDGTFYEFGSMPAENEEMAPTAAAIIAALEAGIPTSDIIRNDPSLVFRANDIGVLRDTLLADTYMVEQRDVTVLYYYGDPGTGKTRKIYEDYNASDICRITTYRNGEARFDAYHGQKVLVFEEFHSQMPINEMLNYLDRYPIMLPARYNDRVACYKTVYITSNLNLSQQYTEYTKDKVKVWEAFLRRINKVVEFRADGTTVDHNPAEYRR